jgi:hypothetical protein
VASYISRFESNGFLSVWDTARQRWCEESTFFARTKRQYLKIFLIFLNKSSATCPEIYSPHARPD